MIKTISMRSRKIFAVFLSLILSVGSVISFNIVSGAHAADETESPIYREMLERAEAIVNYEWVPSQNIAVWNENPYNGKMYFEKGEKIVGMPYTLFSWEFGFDSLLSFSQFKSKEQNNYSVTAYCSSMGAARTGPVYGSCCATFVSEVLGGSFLSEGNPRYDNVSQIQNSSFGTTYRNVKINDLKPGDALSNTVSSHIVWIGEVTETTFTLYEQTPPVARKVIIDKASYSDGNGYFIYGGKTYSTVTKSNELLGSLREPESTSEKYQLPIKAYTISTGKTVTYDSIDGNAKANKIYSTDLCTISRIFENGWCYVTFPLDAGGSDSGYVRLDEFVYSESMPKKMISGSDVYVYSRKDLYSVIGTVCKNGEIFFVGSDGDAAQILYHTSDGYKLGWIRNAQLYDYPLPDICGDINSDGEVNIKDLTRLMKYLSGENVTVNTEEIDVNKDGQVNSKDLTRLMKNLSEQ